MKTIMGIFAAMMLVAMVGCQSVNSTAMLGQKSDKVAKAVEGTWQVKDVVFYAKTTDHQGQVQLAMVQWKDDKWQMQTFTAYATTLGDKAYLNLETAADHTGKDAKPKTYHFIRLLRDAKGASTLDKKLVVLMPRLEAFDLAVTAGKLKGKVGARTNPNVQPSVHLKASAKALNAFVLANDSQKLFNEADPVVLIRLDKAD